MNIRRWSMAAVALLTALMVVVVGAWMMQPALAEERPAPSLDGEPAGLGLSPMRFLHRAGRHVSPLALPGELASIQPIVDRIVVSETYNEVYGGVYTSSVVSLQLLDAQGREKGRNLVKSDGVGHFRARVYLEGVRENSHLAQDIGVNDTLIVGTSEQTYTVRIPEMPATVDLAAEIVSGFALPWAMVDLEIVGQRVRVQADGNGAYRANYVGLLDIMPADGVWILFPANGMWMEKYIFAPGPLVRETLNEVTGYITPGRQVTVSVLSGLGEIRAAQTITSTDTDGSYTAQFGDVIDIMPGDQVVVDAGALLTVPVAAITGQVDTVTDMVSGVTSPNRRVRVLISHIGPAAVEAFNKDVVSDEQGRYSASFAGIVDIQPGDQARVSTVAGDGATEILVPATWLVVDRYGNRLEGVIGPGEAITATLYDPQGVLLETALAESAQGVGYLNIQFQTDVAPGQRLTVVGRGISATLIVADIFANVLVVTDRLVINGPPNSSLFGWYTPQYPQSFFFRARTDASGRAELDLSQTYDLRYGDVGDMYVLDAQGNANYYVFRQPQLTVDAGRKLVYGALDPGVSGRLMVRDALGALKEEDTIVASPEGYFSWRSQAGLQPTDRVTLECCGGRISTVSIVTLTGVADVPASQVYGRGPANSLVECLLEPFANLPSSVRYRVSASTNDAGHYRAVFSDVVRLRSGDRFEVRWQHPDGNWITTEGRTTLIGVNRTQKAVFAQGMRAGAPITITLRDSQGAIRATSSAQVDQAGVLAWHTLPASVRVGDQIEISDGDTITSVEVRPISIEISLADNHVRGVARPNARIVQFIASESAPDGLWRREGEAGQDGIFDVDWSDVLALRAGDAVSVYQFDEQGNLSGATQYALYITIYQTDHQVRAWSAPDSSITFTLRSSLGIIKEERVLRTDPETGETDSSVGRFERLAGGDVLECRVGLLDLNILIYPTRALIDVAGNRVYGFTRPDSPLRLTVWPANGQPVKLSGRSRLDGNFEFLLGGLYQLGASDTVELWYTGLDAEDVGLWSNATVVYWMPLMTRAR